MYKVKEFIGGAKPIDEQINEFLDNNKVSFLDVKYSFCENTYQTQGYAMALLVYMDLT